MSTRPSRSTSFSGDTPHFLRTSSMRKDGRTALFRVHPDPPPREDGTGTLMNWLDEPLALSVDVKLYERFHRMNALWFTVLEVLVPCIRISPMRMAPYNGHAHDRCCRAVDGSCRSGVLIATGAPPVPRTTSSEVWTPFWGGAFWAV